MRSFRVLISAILIFCITLSLCGCGGETTPDPTASIESTAPSTQPAPELSDIYDAAVAALNSKTDLQMDFGSTETRTVSGESYTESRSGTAYYSALGSKNMTALVTENFTTGNYNTQYIQSYINQSGWCRVSNCNFRCSLTAEEFVAQQIPAVLLDRSLYTSLTAEEYDGGTVLYFDGALSLEGWVTDDPDAQLTRANGKLVLDANGNLLSGSYHAEYTSLAASYQLEATMEITCTEALDFSDLQPVYPANCPAINELQLLRHLLRAVGCVYTAENMTIAYQDTMYSQAFGQIRTQSSTYDTYGSGSNFIAALNNQVSITDYTGASLSNSQTATFLDGQYSYRYNDGETTVDSSVTADQVRTKWEDAILSALMMPEHITGAQLTDTGDYLYIRFSGSEALAKSLCSGIYNLFGVDLDAFATSYSTDYIQGYLSVNKHTGLPTAMGISLSRSHVINDVSYRLTYQLDQSLTLGSRDAYENITGEALPETETATATPLLYKVTGADGQTMYLFGTIHVGDGRTANLPQAFQDAFALCDAVAIECDNDRFLEALSTDTALQQQVADAYYYSDGSDVSAHVSDDVWERLQPLMYASGTYNVNAPYLKTIFWQIQLENFYLAQSDSLRAEYGMESRLLAWADQQEKPVYEIESVVSQLNVLSGLSEPLQELLLIQTMELGQEQSHQQTIALYELWCLGDAEALTEALQTDTGNLSADEAALMAEYENAMITERNQGMLVTACEYLESEQTVFFAVGLGHLLGENGLVLLLQDAGYTVEQISYE